jgi:hypothetical protein
VFTVLVGETEVKVVGQQLRKGGRLPAFRPEKKRAINEKVHYSTLRSLIAEFGKDTEELKKQIKSNIDKLITQAHNRGRYYRLRFI